MNQILEHRAFLLLLGIVTIAFCWLLIPFYGAVFWAVVLAIIFQPLQIWFERGLHGRRTAAALATMIVCVVIAVIPIIVILGALVSQGSELVQRAQNGAYDPTTLVAHIQDMLPDWARSSLERVEITDDLQMLRDRMIGVLQQMGQLVATRALNFGQNTLRFVAGIGVMIYVLFFLLRDGRGIGRAIRDAMPFTPDHSRALLARFAAVVRATVKGNIVIAIIQGTIGGVTFWLLGIEGALLWGTLMVFLSLLPAVGAALVWVPAAVLFLLNGEITKGIILIAIGAGVIGLVDNLLRPQLVGKDTRLPDYVVLVSTLGGISIFGINGFVIGPLIAALFFACWAIFRDERDIFRDVS